jgi:uncharacterized protein involved in tellurium resistance
MFVLQPKPTFKSEVSIPTTEGEGKINFVFKHKGRKALKEFFDTLSNEEVVRDDVDALSELVEGWSGVDEKFSVEALGNLLDNYPGAAAAIFAAYNRALLEGRSKN